MNDFPNYSLLLCALHAAEFDGKAGKMANPQKEIFCMNFRPFTHVIRLARVDKDTLKACYDPGYSGQLL